MKHDLLVLNLTFKRLAEELSIIRSEMKNFVVFKENKIKDLKNRLRDLSGMI